jgi:hypothetical protein
MWNRFTINCAWNASMEWHVRAKEPNLVRRVRSMMNQTDLLLPFWGYAHETTAFTPFEIWTGKCPGLSFLKVWGCETYVKCLMSDKLTPKSNECFFVGYPRETKGYYFYNKAEGKVFVFQHPLIPYRRYKMLYH